MALTNIEQKVKGGEESICKTCAHNKVCRYMDNQPCIECSQYAEQERHGRWVERPNTKGQVYCSECGTLEKITDNNFKSMHCPNCGAIMDKEAEDGNG